MRGLRAPVRNDSEVLRSAGRHVSQVRGKGAQADVLSRDSVQGDWLVHHRLREKGSGRRGQGQGVVEGRRREERFEGRRFVEGQQFLKGRQLLEGGQLLKGQRFVKGWGHLERRCVLLEGREERRVVGVELQQLVD